ncbi:hypothetical protein BDZ97DRAFT_1020548 [Flammula alnicola]|nr:hypothetical protein BDZ97DRAFT_1020548 [Flammula alnicola]
MQMTVDILILGAGWTSTFLTPLCDKCGLTYASTSRSGRESTIKFVFDPDSDDLESYAVLPNAHTILITFPIVKKGAYERLIRLYTQTHRQEGLKSDLKARFVQLGTTSMWDGKRLKPDDPVQHKWYDRHSAFVPTPRAEAEEELLALSPSVPTTVLNLSGLWGGTRLGRNWVGKVAPSKEALKGKGSLHVIHGTDVARAILAVHNDFDKSKGQRWLLSDGRVYDWWDIASAWGSKPSSASLDGPHASTTSENEDRGPQAAWVQELMEESGVRALPRDVELLGRALDSRDFWKTFEMSPLHARIEE